MNTPLKLLTISGSDSGGAAGLQADLKTFTALGAYGMCALTVVTAQNSVAVEQLFPLPASFVAAQVQAVLDDYGADGVKTGFIGSAAAVEAIVGVLSGVEHGPLVVDPVLVNHRGESLFGPEVAAAYLERLAPRAAVLTPNMAEAALLANRPVQSLEQMAAAGLALLATGAGAVLVTGGRDGAAVVDLLCTAEGAVPLPQPWIATANVHGSGDTLSAALLVRLAGGAALPDAVRFAQEATSRALRAAAAWRLGGGHGPLAHWEM